MLFACWLAGPALLAADDSKPLRVVPKYARFEQSFKSAVAYKNPPADASVTAVFTSPQGGTTKVYGFWDGGRTWRVRFSPDAPGRWSFKTACSDATNSGLHKVTGEFLCSMAVGKSRYDLHGPVRIAADRRHLEHADKTPFFWLADTAWDGARLSKVADWNYYAQARAAQRFTVAQWVAAPGTNAKKQAAYTGNGAIILNPAYFKQLDAKIETLERAGILSAIVPFREIAAPGTNAAESLPEDQVILLLRNMVARWNADNVVWVLSCEADDLGGNVSRWKRIGRAVFGDVPHAPVILDPGETYWALDQFRAEPWVDMFGYESSREATDDALQWALTGPVATDWKKEPTRPFINLALPYENEPGGQSQQRADPQAVRRAAYWSLLNTPAAGVSYGGHAVLDWTSEARFWPIWRRSLPDWRKAMFMPAAKQMGTIAQLFTSIEFWELRPAPEMIARQPGVESPARHIAAARTLSDDTALVYVPEDRRVDLSIAALPPAPTAIWLNPRTGESTAAANGVDTAGVREFSTPGEGDWLLFLKTAAK
jgi:hypothetical protein